MIFAYATDDRGLSVFADEAGAYSYCEIYDVRDGGWLFFDDDGRPLAAVVTPLPGGWRRFFAGPGSYTLVPQADAPESAMLLNLLPHVASVVSEQLRWGGSASTGPTLGSIEAVRHYLESRTPAP